MRDSIRVLVVEHCDTGRFLAQQLLNDFELDFHWQSVSSEFELRDVAQEFDPGIVLCVDESSASSPHASLDMLRLLSTQKPVILIAEVNSANAMGVTQEQALRPALAGPAAAPAVECAAGGGPEVRYLPAILDTTQGVVVMSDSDGWISYASMRACQLLADSCEQLLVTLLVASEHEVLRAPNWAGAGAGELHEEPVPTGHRAHRRAHRLGFIDDWTRVPAQAHVNDLIGCLTGRARDGNSALALVGLNLDGLQLLSAAHGCAMGDEVLGHMGTVLQSDVTRCGMAARLGQDDFVIVLPDPSLAPDAAIAVQGILDSVAQRRHLPGERPVEPMADLDDADLELFPDDRAEPVSAVTAAPALYEWGAIRWNRAQLQPADAGCSAPDVLPAQVDLEDAIQRQALSLQYQPQFELSSGRGCGVEVLARWTRSNGESMSPSIFIPLAERGGTIRTLGAWVLDCACHTAAGWRGREAQGLTISVNVSTQQIDEQFHTVLSGILKTSGFPAARLELEISESAIIANTQQTIRCLKQWKDLGVRLAVNHFGIDYSSLSYLSRLKVDRLKLDKSLIHNMTLTKKNAGVMDALISLGAELGVDVIAEGVETEPQFRMLAELGCPQVQGYLFARPMQATQAQVALRKTWGNLPKAAFLTGVATSAAAGVATGGAASAAAAHRYAT